MIPFVVFDLDDTLYKEIDYVHSGHNYISHIFSQKYGLNKDLCVKILREATNPFEGLSKYMSEFGGTEDVQWMIEAYRSHFPNIELSHETKNILNQLLEERIFMAIITDGRYISQWNKIKALGLDNYINKSNIIISEVIGCDKHHANGFQLIMRQNPNCSKFFYIGDNTSKDFYWPNKLGWTTICLKDNGKNIHQQNFDIEFEYKPQHIIHNFSDIIPLIL